MTNPLTKGVPTPHPCHTSPTAQKFLAPQNSPLPQLDSHPLGKIRCFKGQGTLSFRLCEPKILTLLEWTAVKEEEIKGGKKSELGGKRRGELRS